MSPITRRIVAAAVSAAPRHRRTRRDQRAGGRLRPDRSDGIVWCGCRRRPLRHPHDPGTRREVHRRRHQDPDGRSRRRPEEAPPHCHLTLDRILSPPRRRCSIEVDSCSTRHRSTDRSTWLRMARSATPRAWACARPRRCRRCRCRTPSPSSSSTTTSARRLPRSGSTSWSASTPPSPRRTPTSSSTAPTRWPPCRPSEASSPTTRPRRAARALVAFVPCSRRSCGARGALPARWTSPPTAASSSIWARRTPGTGTSRSRTRRARST